jgi:hypothetical protein
MPMARHSRELGDPLELPGHTARLVDDTNQRIPLAPFIVIRASSPSGSI